MVTPSFRVPDDSIPDSLVGFAFSDDGGFSQTMNNGHRQEQQGPTRKQQSPTELVDVEAITFQILSELDDDDLFDDSIVPRSTPAPQVVDYGCYDPIC
jgi:hypothetical protein